VAIVATVEFLHLNFSVTIADYIVGVKDVTDIYLVTYTQLLIVIYAMLVKIEIKIMLVDIVLIV